VARYRIVPSRSHVWIDARSNLHPIHSRADGLEGYVDLDSDAAGHVDPDAEPAGRLSFAVSRLTSGNGLEDRELQKRVDSRRFPTIDGVLTRMTSSKVNGRYRVSGDLSFRGVTKRCEDDMTVEFVDAETVTLAGSSTFDIRDFGMEPPKILMFKVDPTVQVRVEIVAEREG
jgi:polyisoprenoid-binding protein YceI